MTWVYGRAVIIAAVGVMVTVLIARAIGGRSGVTSLEFEVCQTDK
jgi:hypothetical protein